MEEISTRRRDHAQSTSDRCSLVLCEQLVILLRTRNEIKFLCNRVSLSLRACIIVDLALRKSIELVEGKVVGKAQPVGNPLLQEAMGKIYMAQLPPDELMYRLNGEKRGGSIHMKNVRRRVYKSLEEKRICKVGSKNMIFNKITMCDYNVRVELINYIKLYLVNGNEDDYKAEALVVCLIFCCALDSILVCMTEKEAIASEVSIKRIREKYSIKRPPTGAIIPVVLNALLNA
ncbi:hypothetical protein OCOL_001611 [Ordospora colligata]|uniref:Uncharacterized protein n=1 Tax=Ordospora colligata OC4 TaxID=1354746 RepID=A0A0B2UJB0_9MICR|nr:uncharacterized protein M896_080280 [Ordospora colligata OC4]KHN69294.1 hypothetical protein M896_080280 [Ordospora colligata OC4]TBU15110.1 hypothetical protein CWI41_080290 [Ordospora colligata]TBU15161.1 hypothetical protein CWI40_080290 [Ordospora colligata]